MSMTTVQVPRVTRTIEERVSVSLDEFKPEEIAEYLRGLGYQVDGTFSRAFLDLRNKQASWSRKKHRSWCHADSCSCDGDTEEGMLLEEDQLSRISTLVLCGQRDSARDYLCEIVGDYLGKAL